MNLVKATNQHLYAYRHYILLAALLMLAIAFPQTVLADGFDGNFGPSKDMSANIFKSIQNVWKNIAAWVLYGALAALVISMLAFGGQYWKIIVGVILIALTGEMIIGWVIDVAGLGTQNNGAP